ncbi:hypothetical protein EUTSA_v10008018mg [Eutrema salsugineum]|uniref:DUF789 domain-containing protein n=1 Tax=Eutrema salsugineum TaxID=72664 RepID=V4KZ33_EUTSA|nr:uncharacterized protein LOC18993365 [Eutrema salsugineum]ESQ35302.1 hypothetical protein EUTSA_v10008018mg [Eutrema salsugineum]
MSGTGFHLNQLQRAKSDVSYGRSIHTLEQENLSAFKKLHASAASSSSNVERFLASVTPSVPAHCLSKTTVRERRGSDVELQPYFVLGDVWDSFAEWSAYGTGVPLTLNNYSKDRVFQYYVPSLSAIQIYADSDALSSSLQTRVPGEESDSDFKDSSSEGSSSESERGLCYPKEHISAQMNQLSLRKQHQEDSSSDDGEPLSSQSRLIFEYLERDLPYIREPFADKMSDLASRFPELKTLRSCDLLPASWFSVAWYPIYKIPTGRTLKDLDACFLTYHSLHTPSQGSGVTTQSMCEVQPSESVEKTALPVFGLASYKLRGSVWTSIKGSGHQLVNSLFQAADNWLRLHQVSHPDFIFFCRQ